MAVRDPVEEASRGLSVGDWVWGRFRKPEG